MFGRPWLSALLFLGLLSPTLGLHFYLNGNEQKCFIEELSKDLQLQGVFSTESLDPASNTWREPESLQVHVTVEVVSTMQKAVDKKAPNKGSFNFVATDYGEHVICVSVSGQSGWFSSSSVRFHLSFFYGEEAAKDHRKEILNDLKWKVTELKNRVESVRREQQYQVEREAHFRDTSEAVNSKVVWWTIFQLVVLSITCFWQLRQLKTFFVTKKLV